MNRTLERLAHFPLKSGMGVFESAGIVHRVEVARTPLGVVRLAGDTLDLLAIVSLKARAAVRALWARVPTRWLERLRITRASGAVESSRTSRKPANVGVRPSAVTLHSEVYEEGQGGQGSSASDREDRAAKQDRRPTKVLEDSIVVAAGKRKVRLTARARLEELSSIAAATGMDPAVGHRFEPAPWAVWRASVYQAPIKTNGVHLRYVLGDGAGVALLATAKQPVAWQVLSWDRDSRTEALVQAYHLLRVHAVRRLHFGDVEQVSVQGDVGTGDWQDRLEATINVPIEQVPGSPYDADLIAFGLAMGALQPKGDVLNLARELQAAPSVLQLMPWGEASFLSALFLCMALMLHAHASGLRQKLHVSTQESKAVVWAHDVPTTKLKQELDALRREVDPLAKFLTREVSFGRTLTSVAEQLPPKSWLVAVSGEDHFWEKNANKSLGERYVLLTAGAPSEREGLAPPEINTTVHGLDEDPYLESVLPRVKLTDVNWRQQGGRGYTVFSLLALPKEAAN